VNLSRLPYIPVDTASVTLSELNAGVPLNGHIAALTLIGPPIEAVVVNGDTHPSSKRVTVKGECRGCGRVLARYTGGLRLTMARPKLAGVEVRLVDSVFVFDCQNPECKIPPKRWPYQLLAVELRTAWDEGRRRFVVT
jgi:hypothetical protein